MAEEEVNYASVVFKASKSPRAEAKKEEETVYDEVKVKQELTEETDDTKADKTANNREGHFRQLACCLGILCVVLVSAIVGFCVYITINLTSEQKQLKEKITILQADNVNLTNTNDNLNSTVNNLTVELDKLNSTVNNLTVELDNLNKTYTALESNNTDVIAENQELETQNQQLETNNQQLETQNQQLETQNQQLETQVKNLNETLQDMETERNELNVSRAQWSIDQYCPIEGDVRKCNSCQAGWLHNESSCYAINNADPPYQRTWDGAQADCNGKISELAVINTAKEKEYIIGKSWTGDKIKGYWIGLRVVDGKWTWLDGSNLTEISWIQSATPTEGHCAISAQNQGLKSVNCSEKNAWICEKKALSLTPPS